jgi:hypothetical protein
MQELMLRQQFDTGTGGQWARGSMNGYKFEAIIHPVTVIVNVPLNVTLWGYCISKLIVFDISTGKTVYNWAGQILVEATCPEVQTVVDEVREHLPGMVYGGSE